MKDIESEPEALTDLDPPEVPVPQAPSTGSVMLPPGAEETADLRNDAAAARRGAGGRRRTGALLAGAALLALAAAASTYFREAPIEAVAPPIPLRPGPATFRVEAEPPGARVWVDEADVGQAPIAVPVAG